MGRLGDRRRHQLCHSLGGLHHLQLFETDAISIGLLCSQEEAFYTFPVRTVFCQQNAQIIVVSRGFGRKLATLYDHHLTNSTIIVRKAKRLATLTNDILCLGSIRFKFHDQSLEGKFLEVHIP
jgi:hypothetical protein